MAVANLESSLGSLDIGLDNKSSTITTDLAGGTDDIEVDNSAVEAGSNDGTVGLPFGHADFVTMGMFIVGELTFVL